MAIPAVLRKRKLIQAKRKVSDSEFREWFRKHGLSGLEAEYQAVLWRDLLN
jgi:hypothetical protein